MMGQFELVEVDEVALPLPVHDDLGVLEHDHGDVEAAAGFKPALHVDHLNEINKAFYLLEFLY